MQISMLYLEVCSTGSRPHGHQLSSLCDHSNSASRWGMYIRALRRISNNARSQRKNYTLGDAILFNNQNRTKITRKQWRPTSLLSDTMRSLIWHMERIYGTQEGSYPIDVPQHLEPQVHDDMWCEDERGYLAVKIGRFVARTDHGNAPNTDSTLRCAYWYRRGWLWLETYLVSWTPCCFIGWL